MSGLRRSTRSSHHTHTARTIACGYSDSSWSVWRSRTGAVASTAAMAMATPRPDPAAHDAVDEHDPDAEAGDLDQLQPAVVEAPLLDERRQQEREAPRVGDRAEAEVGVEDGEAVVGDDLGRVAVEDAAGLAQVQREVVALVVAVAMQVDGEDGAGDDDDAEGDGPAEGAAAATGRGRGGVGRRGDDGVARGRHWVLPRAWIAARRSATFSGLNIVRCHIRAVARLLLPAVVVMGDRRVRGRGSGGRRPARCRRCRWRSSG